MEKSVIMVRHGTTVMNEYLSKFPYGASGFRDPGLYDTRLSPNGELQAHRIRKKYLERLPNDFDKVELIVSSPLTRALQTAEILFGDGVLSKDIPRLALPIASERVWLSSDIGRSSNVLRHEFPEWDFSQVPENSWWYDIDASKYVEWRPSGQYLHPGEPSIEFRNRMSTLKAWLLSRPEEHIILVAHWGVFYALTGRSLKNCDVYKCSLQSIMNREITLTG